MRLPWIFQTTLFRTWPATALLAASFVAALGDSSANGAVLISVDKSAQEMVVSVNGARKYTWPVSTGRPGFSTPTGKFTAFRMEKEHYSKEWDEAPMPNSIFFTMEGHAIHGTLDARHLGSAASHGCVRISTAHAEKLFALVKEEGLPNTKVVIMRSERSAPLVAKRKELPRNGDQASQFRQRAEDDPASYAIPLQLYGRGDSAPAPVYRQFDIPD
jgi:hypothetical protein